MRLAQLSDIVPHMLDSTCSISERRHVFWFNLQDLGKVWASNGETRKGGPVSCRSAGNSPVLVTANTKASGWIRLLGNMAEK